MMLRVTCQKFTATRSGPMYSKFCSGKSAAVTTARTPGSAAARLVSMETMRACACGERRILPTKVPGIFMSAPYMARPVTLGTPSGRTGLVPTHLKPLRASATFTWSSIVLSLARGGYSRPAGSRAAAGNASPLSGVQGNRANLRRVSEGARHGSLTRFAPRTDLGPLRGPSPREREK